MTGHIYAFGSICRGEVTPESDVDLLAITQGSDQRFSSDVYSIYSYARIAEIWNEGNAFAWHLSLESRLLYSPDNTDYLQELGTPAIYQSATLDCEKFFALFASSAKALRGGTNSPIFELSTIFLAVRNFATCYSLGTGIPDFSRHSALRLGSNSLDFPNDAFSILERARLICTRGLGNLISKEETHFVTGTLAAIEQWMRTLLISVGKT
ncbi:nucleotidyltransferase [Pseudomonas sp. RU47]|uniref:nucleotidyltransferase domain-containing protein n=1 Tax=Pseudomonas sp. RU47 TaxID=2005388 RepID=UPI000FDD64C9|nr:nucleotidyltransferase [Pseudomonas sp. RU47]